MMHQKILLGIVRLLLILSIFAGFLLLSWNVSKEYFEYRTSPIIAISEYPEQGVKAPAGVLCFRFDIDSFAEWNIGQLFSGDINYFNDQNDTWNVTKIYQVRIPPTKTPHLVTRKYIRGNKYCLFVKFLDDFLLEDLTSPRYDKIANFYIVDISVEPIFSNNAHPDKIVVNCHSKWVYFQVVADESTIPNWKSRVISNTICTQNFPYYQAFITYSSIVNVKKPSPYDTNCFDYTKGGFLSSYDCYDRCLKNKTEEWGFVPDASIIYRHIHVYNRSNVHMARSSIFEDKNDLNKSYPITSSMWKDMKDFCGKSCYRKDCVSEEISPYLALFQPRMQHDGANLSYIRMWMLTPHQPPIQVSAIPKHNFLAYIVYMSSSLSFWLGLCPLTLTENLVRRLQEYTKKKKATVTLEQRIRYQYSQVQSQREQLKRHERELTRINEILERVCRNDSSSRHTEGR